jgi:hypothetical protein
MPFTRWLKHLLHGFVSLIPLLLHFCATFLIYFELLSVPCVTDTKHEGIQKVLHVSLYLLGCRLWWVCPMGIIFTLPITYLFVFFIFHWYYLVIIESSWTYICDYSVICVCVYVCVCEGGAICVWTCLLPSSVQEPPGCSEERSNVIASIW